MVLTMVPMTAFAAGTDCTGGDDCTQVATIGTKHYATITDAIGEAADGSNEIKLLQETTEALTIAEGKDIVLDLNEKTLTTNIKLRGRLEVKDTVGGGVIVNDTETTNHAITVNANAAGTEAASLTLTSGTIKTVKSSKSAIYVNGGSTKASCCFTMNGGMLLAANNTANYKGKPIAKLAHTYKNGKCTVCGALDPNYRPTTDPTEPTEPTPSPTVDPGNDDPKPTDKPTSSPQPGDDSNIWLWVSLLFAADAGIVGVVLYDRRKTVKH